RPPDPHAPSLHDALPIYPPRRARPRGGATGVAAFGGARRGRRQADRGTPARGRRLDLPCLLAGDLGEMFGDLLENFGFTQVRGGDRKSTRLNSSHVSISY